MNRFLRRPVLSGLYGAYALKRRVAPAPARADDAVRRVLVIALGTLGDSLMATPALRAVARRFPHASITVLGRTYNSRIFEENPVVMRLLNVEGGILRAAQAETVTPYDVWRATPRLVRTLRAGRYDVGIAFETNRRQVRLGDALLYLADIPRRHGPAFAEHAPRFTATVDPGRVTRWVQYFHDLVMCDMDQLPAPASEEYDFTILDSDRAAAVELLRAGSVSPEQPFVLIHPGAKAYATPRRWSPEQFAAVADAVAERYGWAVILSGGEEDAACVESVRARMQRPALSVAGRASLGAVAALVERSALVVTNDTALLHLAAAVRDGPPIIAIFGPTDEQKIAPAIPRCHIVRTDIFCAPCFSAWDPPPHCTPVDGRTPCFDGVTVEVVLNTIGAVVSSGAPSGPSLRVEHG